MKVKREPEGQESSSSTSSSSEEEEEEKYEPDLDFEADFPQGKRLLSM